MDLVVKLSRLNNILQGKVVEFKKMHVQFGRLKQENALLVKRDQEYRKQFEAELTAKLACLRKIDHPDVKKILTLKTTDELYANRTVINSLFNFNLKFTFVST